MEIIAQHSTVFYVMAFAFGLCVCWGMGANNVANAGTPGYHRSRPAYLAAMLVIGRVKGA